MDERQFVIDISDFYWINGDKDDPEDRCLHGNVSVKIGEEAVAENYPCTVSSTALYLLKSIKEDHVPGESANQMLPCCGFFIIPNDAEDTVEISGCLVGIDWTILHEDDCIRLITAKGTEVKINFEKYRDTVFALADKVQDYYSKCRDKIMPDDDFYLRGYLKFWKEWTNRRNNQ